jgi:mono/diheme cytochrome c family protein
MIRGSKLAGRSAALAAAVAALAGVALPAAAQSSALARIAAVGTHGAGVDRAPTFYSDVLPILQQNCQVCHQGEGRGTGGMIAPMALESYDQVRPWAPVIAAVVREGRMPPWGAHEQHQGTFLDERYLTPEEKATLIGWAESGAPPGDPSAASPPPSREVLSESAGWWLGEPDLVVAFAEPVHVADDVDDWQPTIHVPVSQEQHPEARWVQASELRAGGPYVHHIVSSHLGVGTPGRGAFTYPDGWGVLLPTDPFVTFNMHYYKTPGPGTAIDDLTEGAFKFYEKGAVIDFVVETDLNMTQDFLIPAGDPNYSVSKARPFEEDTYLLSMGPHMHYRGKAVRVELELPDGEREVLLWVPKYDFNWQFLYQYREPRFIPAGSVLHTTWWFDNSVDNPYNPDPTVDVGYGIETYHEMANSRIYFAPAKPRGIVVGEEIPEDVLTTARQQEDRRRQQLQRTGAVDDGT